MKNPIQSISVENLRIITNLHNLYAAVLAIAEDGHQIVSVDPVKGSGVVYIEPAQNSDLHGSLTMQYVESGSRYRRLVSLKYKGVATVWVEKEAAA